MQKRGMAAILLTLVLLAALLPRALAAGRVDLNRELQLHLSYQKDGVALAGAQVSIYRVAEMDETGGTLDVSSAVAIEQAAAGTVKYRITARPKN